MSQLSRDEAASRLHKGESVVYRGEALDPADAPRTLAEKRKWVVEQTGARPGRPPKDETPRENLTVRISEETRAQLEAFAEPEESLSDAVTRLIRQTDKKTT